MEKGLRDTMRQPRVNIVIVNYNSYSYTAACLSSLFKSTYDNYRILIVDNHSSDNSIEELSAWLDEQNLNYGICKPEEHEVTKQIEKPEVRVILIRNNRNSGFGAGNNRALKPLIKSSSEDYIWLLNPDTEVEPEVMNDLVLATGNGEKIITGNSIYEFINRDKIIYCGGFKVHKNYHGMTDIVDPKAIGHIDAIAGASLFTP
ncbi:MAG: glycosyltransferase, partial [Bacteroidia bacterium]|nr:glycosyltransferase [Bacteroidia bacterium]